MTQNLYSKSRRREKITVYQKRTCGKLIRWWTCPFCDKRIIKIYLDHVDILALRHLLFHHGDIIVSEREAHDYVYGTLGDYEKDELTDEILVEAVIKKL